MLKNKVFFFYVYLYEDYFLVELYMTISHFCIKFATL